MRHDRFSSACPVRMVVHRRPTRRDVSQRSVRPRRDYFRGAWQSETTQSSYSSVSNFEISHARSWLSPKSLMYLFHRRRSAYVVCTTIRPCREHVLLFCTASSVLLSIFFTCIGGDILCIKYMCIQI